MLASLILSEGGGEVGPKVLMGVLVFLLVFALMVLIGWWAKSTGKLAQEEEPVHADDHGHGEHAHAAHDHVDAKPAKTAAVAKPDDLVALEGIGPKVAKLLNEKGIFTYKQLGDADLGELRKILDAAGYKYMEPAGWVEQAKLAAAGDTVGLKKLQDSLKGGRKVS